MSKKITLRRYLGEFPDTIKKDWYMSNFPLTNLLNTYTLLVPDNERYYIRHINKSLKNIEDLELKNIALRFIRQEGQHGIAHEKFWKNLENENYRIRTFIKFAGIINYKITEAIMPLKIHLSIIAAIEHINAYTGQIFLEYKLMDNANINKKLLFNWHFAEEIEHKSVTIDILRVHSKSYVVRIIGMIITAPCFYISILAGTIMLTYQSKSIWNFKAWSRWLSFLFSKEKVAWLSLKEMAKYFRYGFHPDQIDNLALVNAYTAIKEVSPINN